MTHTLTNKKNFEQAQEIFKQIKSINLEQHFCRRKILLKIATLSIDPSSTQGCAVEVRTEQKGAFGQMESKILRAGTVTRDVSKALEELSQKSKAKEAKFSICFFSPVFDREILAREIPKYLGQNVFGCTTAGELGPNGFMDDAITIVSFHGEEFEVTPVVLENISEFSDQHLDQAQSLYNSTKLIEKKMGPDSKTFAFLLIDGLSGREEIVTGRLANVFREISLIGGSAGDKLDFKNTWLLSGNRFIENSAIVLLITTTRPFEVFKTQHFSETNSKIVITSSEPEKRIVHEIDGMPAAEAYASALGMEIKNFTPMVFSKNPVMLKLGDEFYVRSIQKVNPDNSLTFYCAIDDGLVLTLANRNNFLESAENEFQRLKSNLGELDVSLLCECILRKLEVDDMKPEDRKKVQDLYSNNNVVGFHTYGEQYGSLHINQTMTGVAFGKPRKT